MSWQDAQRKLNSFGYQLSVDGIPGPRTFGALFAYMGAKDAAPVLGLKAATQFEPYGVTSPLRISHWLAQFGVESRNFTTFEEDLNYSAARLCQVWPRRFPSIVDAEPYANRPEAVADKVYGGRMGNTLPDDGWRFRGRGPGLTGRANYAACASRTGLPLIADPDAAAKPENFVLIACDYWQQHGCNALADRDELAAITVKAPTYSIAINGGEIGLSQRAALLKRAKAVLL